MQPRRRHTVQRSNDEANQPLPAQLAQDLEPRARRALMHGMRRRILRVLGDATPRTAKDLLTTFPGVSLGTITYHALVLGECGSVTASPLQPAQGNCARSFVSNVAGNAQYVVVLGATEQLDDVH